MFTAVLLYFGLVTDNVGKFPLLLSYIDIAVCQDDPNDSEFKLK